MSKTYLDCKTFESDIQGGVIVKLHVLEDDDTVDLENYDDAISIDAVKRYNRFEEIGECNTCGEELSVDVVAGVVSMSQEAKDHFRVIKADGSGDVVVG